MRRFCTIISMLAIFLAGCGSSVPTQPAASAGATAPAASPESVESAPTTAPSKAPQASISADVREQIEQGYTVLAMLDIVAVMTEETAQQVKDGKLAGPESIGNLLVIGMMTSAAEEALAKDAPNPALAEAWEKARPILPKLTDVLGRWTDKKISSDEIPGEISALRPEIDAVMATAESNLELTYGVAAAELQQKRADMLAELRTNLQERPTPVPEPSVTAQPGTSRNDPLALETGVRFETWAVTVTDVLRGEEASAQIKAANQFNEPVREGYEYILATFELENIGTDQEAQSTSFATQVRVTGDRNQVYSQSAVVAPREFEGELFPGGKTIGQKIFEVPTGETNLMFMLEELASFDQPAVFVALDRGATIDIDPALEALEATDAGRTRDNAAKIGDTVTTDDWQVTVLEFKRGEEAAALAKEANQFNEVAGADQEYVLIKVRARYIGTDDVDKPQEISGSSFKMTGEKNRVYDSPAIVAPSPTLEGQLFPGGETEGWVILSVTSGEGGLRVVFEPLFSFNNDEIRYIAVE